MRVAMNGRFVKRFCLNSIKNHCIKCHLSFISKVIFGSFHLEMCSHCLTPPFVDSILPWDLALLSPGVKQARMEVKPCEKKWGRF
jgi:hypothetical protein